MEKLRNIYDDREFVIGVLSDVRSEEGRKEFIKYFEENPEITSSEVILSALAYSNSVKKSKW